MDIYLRQKCIRISTCLFTTARFAKTCYTDRGGGGGGGESGLMYKRLPSTAPCSQGESMDHTLKD